MPEVHIPAHVRVEHGHLEHVRAYTEERRGAAWTDHAAAQHPHVPPLAPIDRVQVDDGTGARLGDKLPDVRAEVADAVSRVQDYLAPRARFVLMDDLGDDRTEAVSFAGIETHIAPKVTTAVSGLKARQELQYQQRMGWVVPGGEGLSLADHVVAHESGHLVAWPFDEIARDQGLWDEIAAAMGLPPPVLHGAQLWRAAHQREIAKAVSIYGATDIGELVAELWHEYVVSDHPRPPARVLGDYIRARRRTS